MNSEGYPQVHKQSAVFADPARTVLEEEPATSLEIPKLETRNLKLPYCGLVCGGGGVDFVEDFFLAGFLGGSLSSTTTFLGCCEFVPVGPV